jgi:hypothetical protein
LVTILWQYSQYQRSKAVGWNSILAGDLIGKCCLYFNPVYVC